MAKAKGYFLLGGKQNRCGQDMEKIWRKSAGSELMGNQGQECSSQNALSRHGKGTMQKEPCEQRSLCACCQIFQPEMKERNFENKYLKETKEWVSTRTLAAMLDRCFSDRCFSDRCFSS